MSDYIKREDAENAFRVNGLGGTCKDGTIYITTEGLQNVNMRNSALALLRRIPSADVVEVVRCKECKYYKEYIPRKDQSAMMCFCPCCLGGQGKKKPTDYCSYGERRTDEHK